MKKHFVLFFLAASLKLYAQDPPMIKITAVDRDTGDCYGWSAAVSGRYYIVGAPEKRRLVNNRMIAESGAIYIDENCGGLDYCRSAVIHPPVPKSFDYFGCSVSISGQYAAVGADGDDSEKVDSTSDNREGAVYLYRRLAFKNWVLDQKLTLAKRHMRDQFGNIVCINSGHLAVAAPGFQNVYNKSGAVFIYSNKNGGKWDLEATIAPPDSSINYFGCSLSLCGTKLIVGSAKPAGAYIYSQTLSGKWEFTAKLSSPDTTDHTFGAAVGIDGKMAIVGAPGNSGPFEGSKIPNTDSVYSYLSQDENFNFKLIQVLNNKRMKDSLGISEAEFKSHAVPVETLEHRKRTKAGAGKVYVYMNDGGYGWNLRQTITPFDAKYDQHFGNCLSLSKDRLLIGAFGDRLDDESVENNFYAGAAYLFFQSPNGNWVQLNKITATRRSTWVKFGFSVCVDGHVGVIGSRFDGTNGYGQFPMPRSGAMYLYQEK